jgi:hypothetical protein
MVSSKEWDGLYSQNEQLSIWPWSDLISYTKIFVPNIGPLTKVLELGCGAGANIPFFESLNTDYHAIEGSSTIVQRLIKKFAFLEDKIKVGDFTKKIYWDKQFDIIVDRASVTHNNTLEIQNCLSLVHDHLINRGYFIGIDWFSTNHSDYKIGESSVDEYTKTNYKKGQFKNVGKVHFSNKDHLIDLLHKFKIIKMEEKLIKTEIPSNEHIFSSWNFVAQKIDE